jgi:hypothetical protein
LPVTFGDDADAVREYVDTFGGLDYVGMYESGDECIAVEFSGNVARHEQTHAASVEDADHVRVLAGPLPDYRRSELAHQYWEPREDTVFVACEGRLDIKELSFGYDDGPFLSVGLLPYSPAAVQEAARTFAPYRIKAFQGPDVVAL